jgi:hypothetical protein
VLLAEVVVVQVIDEAVPGSEALQRRMVPFQLIDYLFDFSEAEVFFEQQHEGNPCGFDELRICYQQHLFELRHLLEPEVG